MADVSQGRASDPSLVSGSMDLHRGSEAGRQAEGPLRGGLGERKKWRNSVYGTIGYRKGKK